MLQTVRHRAHQATTTVVDKDVADWLTAGPDYESVGHPFAAPRSPRLTSRPNQRHRRAGADGSRLPRRRRAVPCRGADSPGWQLVDMMRDALSAEVVAAVGPLGVSAGTRSHSAHRRTCGYSISPRH